MEKLQVIYGDSWEGLTLNMVGHYHDHCYHYYSGLTINVPDKWKNLIKEDKKFVFLYEEDTP